jgi:Protein of unknown function (DUF4231)
MDVRSTETDPHALLAEAPAVDPTMERVEQQIDWYDRRSRHAQRLFKSLKAVQIVAAASIPVLTSVGAPVWIAGANGALIVILEGIQQMNQYQQLWVTYRATAEALKHEKYLSLAEARPYAGLNDQKRRALFAERVESLISQEDSKWKGMQQQSPGSSAEAASAT